MVGNLIHENKVCYAPWDWMPSKSFWFAKILKFLDQYNPHPDLQLDVEKFRNNLQIVTSKQEEWFYHPFVEGILNRDLSKGNNLKLKSDMSLAIYLSQNRPVNLGHIQVPETFFLWSNHGGVKIEAGKYDVETLGQKVDLKFNSSQIFLDACCHSIGKPVQESWFWRDLQDENQSHLLSHDIENFYTMVSQLQIFFPHWFQWIKNVVRIVVPLARFKVPAMSSFTFENGPGYVCMDLFAEQMMLLKILIHETAHLYFHISECAGTFIDPDHQDLYWSPLKRTSRPLRNVLLAYHAMVFMAAFLKEALKAPIEKSLNFNSSYHKLIEDTRNTRENIDAQKRHFTDLGLVFLEKTHNVFDFAIS